MSTIGGILPVFNQPTNNQPAQQPEQEQDQTTTQGTSTSNPPATETQDTAPPAESTGSSSSGTNNTNTTTQTGQTSSSGGTTSPQSSTSGSGQATNPLFVSTANSAPTAVAVEASVTRSVLDTSAAEIDPATAEANARRSAEAAQDQRRFELLLDAVSTPVETRDLTAGAGAAAEAEEVGKTETADGSPV